MLGGTLRRPDEAKATRTEMSKVTLNFKATPIGGVANEGIGTLDVARLWDRDDNRLMEWLGEGPRDLEGQLRVAAVLPTQGVTAEDCAVFETFGVLVVTVPEEMATVSPAEVTSHLAAVLSTSMG